MVVDAVSGRVWEVETLARSRGEATFGVDVESLAPILKIVSNRDSSPPDVPGER